MSRRLLFMVALVMSLAGAGASGAGESYKFWGYRNSNPEVVHDFTLTGPGGRPYSLASQRGKVVLLAFGFTHCPNICPTTLANLASIYESLTRSEQAQLQVLFVTIDPQRDSVAVLKEYVPFFDQHFIGLTGTPKEVAAVGKDFGVEVEKTLDWGGSDANYTMSHSAGARVLSPGGHWLSSYGSEQLTQRDRVAEDLRHFIAQSHQKEPAYEWENGAVIKTAAPTGREIYLKRCASCHGNEGEGKPHKAMALVSSKWVTGPPNRLTALVWNGAHGEPLSASTSAGVMPAWWRILTPRDLAAVLTYIRRAWGNEASAISESYARDLGYRFSSRKDFWTLEELEALPAETAAAGAAKP